MEFRSIASLEELETLPDDAQILIIDNNTAKRISKKDFTTTICNRIYNSCFIKSINYIIISQRCTTTACC